MDGSDVYKICTFLLDDTNESPKNLKGTEVYRIYTYHRTQVIVNPDWHLSHRKPEDIRALHLPLYALHTLGGYCLFAVKDEVIVYIRSIDEKGLVEKSNEPGIIEHIRNENGTISFVQGNRQWSARKQTTTFELSANNLEWEHYTLERVEFDLTSEFIPPTVLGLPTPIPDQETSPKISVVIPMFNTEKYIGETLNSILKQSMQDFEVVIVDDCSTDKSVEIVKSFMERFNGRLKLIELNKNSGQAGTPRNIGLRYAAGKYVYFLDSDDAFKEKALESLYNAAEKYQVDVLHLTYSNSFEQYDLAKRVRDFLDWRYNNIVWGKLFRRRFLIENNILCSPTFSVEDAIFVFQSAMYAKIYCRAKIDHHIHRLRPGSLTGMSYPVHRFLTKQIKTIEIIFKMLNDCLGQFDFFEQHQLFAYNVYKFFLEYHVKYIARIKTLYDINSAPELYARTHKIMSDGVRFSDELIAIILTNEKFLPAQLKQRDSQIEKLERELNQLQAQSN